MGAGAGRGQTHVWAKLLKELRLGGPEKANVVVVEVRGSMAGTLASGVLGDLADHGALRGGARGRRALGVARKGGWGRSTGQKEARRGRGRTAERGENEGRGRHHLLACLLCLEVLCMQVETKV